LRHPSRERRNLQVEANTSHDFGLDISVQNLSLTGGMYRGDGALSDGTEHLPEETSDKAEHPLTAG